MTRQQFGICVVNSTTQELFEIERADTYEEAIAALIVYAAASPQDDLCVFDREGLTVLSFKRGGTRLRAIAGGAP